MAKKDRQAERQAAMHKAKMSDYRVEQLIHACRNANKGAIVSADAKWQHPYSVDHIVPLSQDGGDFYINLWICPMEWNTLNGMMERGPNTIKAILQWIEINGRICQIMPLSILMAEKQDLLDGIAAGKYADIHWSYDRILRLGLGQ